jgi:uncharacterized FAD-dependent dehydrogenase
MRRVGSSAKSVAIRMDQMPTRRVWDVIVAGAGPAGLFAALGIASASDQKVLLLDAGADIQERRGAALQACDPLADGSEYLKGVGGAGLFSDGKLCLSLEVGGHLRATLSPEKKRWLVETIAKCFGAPPRYYDPSFKHTAEVSRLKQRASSLGLKFKHYPVFHIGTDKCRDVILALRGTLLRSGVELLPRCELESLADASGGGITAQVVLDSKRCQLTCRNMVLALGKVGASNQARLCQSLGVGSTSRPLYIGLRLETSSRSLAPLFKGTKDPKYSMEFPDGSKIKTHCASNGGQVLLLRYEGLPLAGGHGFRNLQTGRSSLSILWDIRGEREPYLFATNLMARVASHTEGLLLAQRAEDYLAGVPSSEIHLSQMALSNRLCRPGNVRDFLPREYFNRLDCFLQRLLRIVPDLLGKETVFYAPSIEWWMDQIDVESENMETARSGLYVCGDGSGWSQGIVHAAATGLLAAEGIAGKALCGDSHVVGTIAAIVDASISSFALPVEGG